MMRLIALALLVAAGALGTSGCSNTDEPAEASTQVADGEQTAGVDSPARVNSVAYKYFGAVEIARGSSPNTTVDGVASSDAITVVETPAGVTATIVESGDDTTQLELEISDDAPLGEQGVTFEIDGEDEQVVWLFDIVSR